MAVQKPYFSGNASIAGGSPPPTKCWLGENPGPPHDKRKNLQKGLIKMLKTDQARSNKATTRRRIWRKQKKKDGSIPIKE